VLVTLIRNIGAVSCLVRCFLLVHKYKYWRSRRACVLVTLMRNKSAVSNGLRQTICSGLRSSILTYAGVC
jgi:hypothetical protein